MEVDTDTGPLSSREDHTRRATEFKKRVLETETNHGGRRCIVENCDTSRAIEYCHILARSKGENDSLVRGFGILE